MNESNNINNLCRVCLQRRPQTEMLSVNESQLEKLLFIGDSNKIIRLNGQPPNLCIECGFDLDSVYDFIVKLRMNTLQMKKQEQAKLYNSSNQFIKSERSPSQSNELTLPYEATVPNVIINCKDEPNLADLQHQTAVPYDLSPVHNVVVHCKVEPAFTEFEMSPLQLNSNVLSQFNCTAVSELHPEPRDSLLSTKSVDDMNALLKSKSNEVLGHTEECVNYYAQQKSQSGDGSRGSSSSIEPKTTDELKSSWTSKEMSNRIVGPIELSIQKPQPRDDASGSFLLIKQKTTDELKLNSKKMLNTVENSTKKPPTGHPYLSTTDDSIDATKICQLCARTFSSVSKMLHHHVREYSGPGFSCPVEECNFIFTHKSNLESHIKGHTVIKPYGRKQLDANTFAREGHLKSALHNPRKINAANGNGGPSHVVVQLLPECQ